MRCLASAPRREPEFTSDFLIGAAPVSISTTMPKAIFTSLSLLSTELPVAGLAQRLRILHVDGAHLCECDHRDLAEGERLAKLSLDFGGDSLANLDRLIYDIPHIAPDFVAFTGDLMESPTAANWEALASRLSSLRVPFGLTLGDRDWALSGDWAHARRQSYRERQWLRFIAEHRWSPEFEETALCGARLAFLDNSDYQVRLGQFRQLNQVLRTGFPTVLFCHIPLSLPPLRNAVIEQWGDPVLCGGADWEAERRARWGILPHNTPITRRFHSVALAAPSLVAVFAGHVDMGRKDRMPNGAFQYLTPPLCQGFARLITLIPAGRRKKAAAAAPIDGLSKSPRTRFQESPARFSWKRTTAIQAR